VRQSETAAARDVARSFGLINKQFTFVSASSPFAVHWPTTNTQHNGWLIVQIDLLALIRFYGLNSIEGQKMRTHTHTGTHNAHTHTRMLLVASLDFLCFWKLENRPLLSFQGIYYILYIVRHILSKRLCLPGIENSLRPFEMAPYDLLSKLSIALIIVAPLNTHRLTHTLADTARTLVVHYSPAIG